MHVDAASMRPVLTREVSLRGPRFFRSGEDRGLVLFVNYIDASTREGPREATTRDAELHAAAFEDFVTRDAAEQQGRAHPPGKPLEAEPLRPLVTFMDPPGGKPPREKGQHELRREAARGRGEVV